METNTTTWAKHPLSCAQVLELPEAAAYRSHMSVGFGVAFGGTSAPMAELAAKAELARLVRPQVQVQGTNGSNGKHGVSKPRVSKVSVIGTDPVGGVRGIPPRGWPV